MTRNFPNFIDAFMDYTKNIPTPEKFLRWSAISVIAGALERKTWISYNNYQCYPNIFVFLIGASAIRKTVSSGKAMDLLKSIPDLKFLSDHINQASAIRQLHEAGNGRYLKIGEESYNNSSGFLYSAEAVTTIREAYGSMTELLTDLYDNGPNGWHKDRAWEKATMIDGTIKIFNPCLNMLACSTPDWLVRIVKPQDIKGGFFSRVFFIVHQGKVQRRELWESDEEHDSNPVVRQKLINDLSIVSKIAGAMKVSPAVKELHNDFMAKNREFMELHPHDQFLSFYGRKAFHLLKLSQIMSAAESSAKIIEASHWEKAKAALSEIEADMRVVFKTVSYNSNHSTLRVMWDDLRHKMTFSQAEVMLKYHHAIPRKLILEALDTMAEMQLVVPYHDGRTQSYRVISREPLI